MIPVRLRLKNFLSYRDVILNFQGLHVACVCGANGAGKSSLLEAIAWSIWGQSRAHTEDDVVHMGEKEAQVDYTFTCHQQTYRVIRTRYRGQTSALEFQIQTEDGFRSLTGRGMRATQQIIHQHLRIDYETFVNSAYLRQGRADEFMLKRPGERKQILADLLKLGEYDDLAERAKERSRDLKAEVTVLERSLEAIAHQLQDEPALIQQQHQLNDTIATLRTQQDTDREQLKTLHHEQQQRQAWQQDMTLQQQQQQYLRQECDRLSHDQRSLQHQVRQLESVLAEAQSITEQYGRFQSLLEEDDRLTQQSHTHQTLQQQLQTLQRQHDQAIAALTDQVRQAEIHLNALVQQDHDLESILAKADQVAEAFHHSQQARQRLVALDQLQTQATPLLQRQQQLCHQLDQHRIRLTVRLEEVQSSVQQLGSQQQQQPALQQAIVEVATQIEYLEKRRSYQQQVRERGTERRSFMERLQERQRDLQTQLAELDQKIQMLHANAPADSPLVLMVAASESAVQASPMQVHNSFNSVGRQDSASPSSPELTPESVPESSREPTPESASYPPCPLCDRPLDAHHWQVVLTHHQDEYREVEREIWVIREQLAAAEKEIRVLRQEYRELDQELAAHSAVLERRGRLQEQMNGVESAGQSIQALVNEQSQLEQMLQTQAYGTDSREELSVIEQRLETLSYDEKDHALARGQVDRWRWAEIKQVQVQQAQKRRSHLRTQIEEQEKILTGLTQNLKALDQSERQQQIHRLTADLAELAYDADRHTQVRQNMRQAQTAQLRYQELTQARHHHPLLQERLRAIALDVGDRQTALIVLEQKLQQLSETLQRHPDRHTDLQVLDDQITQRRSQLDDAMAQLGRLQQQMQQFDQLKQQQQEQREQLQQLLYQAKLYRELTQAFGKNGIQALMIENILPQLETEANHILGRLSANQLHIQFVTQRASKSQTKASRKVGTKLIDTLDILIGDTQGTRSYETYSGGEAFRVNFAIRLAIARLLAQRSGTALQLLIVDEGFGTQDQPGCDRLVSAINAIASDFACILTVTHMPHLREAFQSRIEVTKTAAGSQLNLVS
ncbi:MAG: SMC family ATPase [Elainellaceae cyanobacterium]